MRIDQLLVQRGLASTRSQAQRLIADGVQWRKLEVAGEVWKRVAKNGDEVPEDAAIELLDDSEARYVSRGGLKLEAALKQVGLSVKGLRCLDVGQSTGGFTDCLLQAGALAVVGVDVGISPGGGYDCCMKEMHKHTSHPDLVKRLKRAEGHLRHVIGMIEGEETCLDIARQLAAVESAVTAAKRVLIHDHIDHCLSHDEDSVLAEMKALTRLL